MTDSICRIKSSDYASADAELRAQFDSVRSDRGQLDNLYRAFSLRGHMMKPADDLYRAVLHHDRNTISKRDSELFGCYVAILTQCDYATAHHSHNFRHLREDNEHADQILDALSKDRLGDCGDAKTIAALRFVGTLTRTPGNIQDADIEVLRTNDWTDGEILEIVQIVAMFSYFVRVINALGISQSGESTGLY